MKNLKERLQKGINESAANVDNYEEVTAATEKWVNVVLDTLEGKKPDYAEFFVRGGTSTDDNRIIIISGDGEDLLLVEFQQNGTVRVQPQGYDATVLNEEDAEVMREFENTLLNSKRTQRDCDESELPEEIAAILNLIRGRGVQAKVTKLSGLDDLKKAVEDAGFGKQDEPSEVEIASEKLVDSVLTKIAMDRLHCPKEIAESLVAGYKEFMGKIERK